MSPQILQALSGCKRCLTIARAGLQIGEPREDETEHFTACEREWRLSDVAVVGRDGLRRTARRFLGESKVEQQASRTLSEA